eukprot:TRINITY_DN2058_c0_g1_i4.p1 TRINITY_DN2058_c0_g1~~TRINITY_DN2058_c0_g1_i4.p1  ORF type:complete len:195 (+),score=26.31 TRINITY_DN2058_c0_g1_i4:47-631(+)
MRTILLLAAISFVLALSGPVISDNWVALADVLIDGKIVERVHIWYDYQDQKTRLDFEITATKERISQINLYKSLKSYDINEKAHTCTVTPLTSVLKPAFEFAQNATLDTNPCHSGVSVGKIGALWYTKNANESLYLCYDNKEHVPFWFEMVTPRFHDYIRFHAFLPGIPPASVFDLPALCNNPKTDFFSKQTLF